MIRKLAFSLRHLVDKCQRIAQSAARLVGQAIVMNASVTVADELLTTDVEPRVCVPKRTSGCGAWRIERADHQRTRGARHTLERGNESHVIPRSWHTATTCRGLDSATRSTAGARILRRIS